MCLFLAPAEQPEMMHQNFTHWHLYMFCLLYTSLQDFRRKVKGKMEKNPEKFKEIYSCTGMNRRIYCIRKKGETDVYKRQGLSRAKKLCSVGLWVASMTRINTMAYTSIR